MYRALPYILLFIAATLLQAFFFDHLVLGPLCSPLVYIAPVILLPLDTRPIAMLGTGLLCGLTADYAMGIAGLNIVATLPIAFLRPNIVALLSMREDNRDEGIPSPERMGARLFWSYVVAMVALHHLLFFTLEALSWEMLPRTLLRILLSGAVTVAAVGLAERLLTAKLVRP